MPPERSPMRVQMTDGRSEDKMWAGELDTIPFQGDLVAIMRDDTVAMWAVGSRTFLLGTEGCRGVGLILMPETDGEWDGSADNPIQMGNLE